MSTVRAIYEDGRLRLLEPIDLKDGQEVEITVLTKTNEAALRAALADLNIRWSSATVSDAEIDEEALALEVEAAFQGDPPLSQIIIEDRGEP